MIRICLGKRIGRYERRGEKKNTYLGRRIAVRLSFEELLNPLRYGILSFQYVSHRVLRWSVTPVALFLLFPLNILLVVCSESLPVYFLFLLLQSAFYLGGVYGSLCLPSP